MSNIRRLPTSKVRWVEFYADTMRLKHIRGQNLTCFQNNVIHNFKAMGDEILYQELPLTHTHTPYVLYMQSSGPAALPGFLRSPDYERWAYAGLSGGDHNILCIGFRLRAVLERCWSGSMLGSADFVRCQSGLGFSLWQNFCTSYTSYSTI